MLALRESDPGHHGQRHHNATHSAVSPHAADGCFARMMRKPNGARLTSDAALMHWYGIGPLVRHEQNRHLVGLAVGSLATTKEPRSARGGLARAVGFLVVLEWAVRFYGVAALVAERGCGRRPAGASPSDLEPAVGSRSSGSNRKGRARRVAGL